MEPQFLPDIKGKAALKVEPMAKQGEHWGAKE